MKPIRWSPEKALTLKATRGIDFEKIAVLIEEGALLGVARVPHRNQSMFLVDYEDYVVSVPFVESAEEIFLKTAYRNRKLNRIMGR